jgi:hypothetical protein
LVSVNAREEEYEHVELFGRPALFTNSRIDRGTVPEGFHCYDLRGSDRDPGKPTTVENRVAVNHAGTVLTAEPITIPREGFRRLRGGRQNYGYIVETEHYRYCLRCNPGPGDYQAYLAAFDLRVQQRMNMKQKTPAQDCGLEDGIGDQTPEQGITMGGL